jgi:hypothetical protein
MANPNEAAWYLHPQQKSATSLPATIAIMDESDRQINFNSLKKSTTLLSAPIRALGSPLGPHPESDLVIDLYSVSTPIANMDMFSCQISFNSLNKSTISLLAVIGVLGSPLGPHPESNLETDLYSGSTPIAINTSPIAGWLCPSSQLWWDGSIRLQWPLQAIKHLADLSLSWGQLTQ